LSTDLRIQFAQLDKDGDGEISPKELSEVMQSLGLNITIDVVRRVLERADLDCKLNNGCDLYMEIFSLLPLYRR
jgi:Ca2+-binding EF-hand superfamily protein